jgi:hypothetical protein
MSYCTRIQNAIDEADKPDLIPREVASHMSGCPECRSFADDRAKLQELLALGSRVTVPVNFNAVLNERLSRVKAQKSSWVSSIGFVRLGTATAALAVAVVAVQYSGILSGVPASQTDPNKIAGQSDVEPQVQPPRAPELQPVPSGSPAPVVAVVDNTRLSATHEYVRTAVRQSRETPREQQRRGISILVRDRDQEFEVPIIGVSIGLQQQLLNASGRHQPRSTDISY